MPIKSAKYTYGGINQDTSKSKHQPQFYYEAQHIRIISEDSQTTGAVTNEKGTELAFIIPNNISVDTTTKLISYGSSVLTYENTEISDMNITNYPDILGHVNTKDSVILITGSGTTNVVWEVKDIYNDNTAYNIELLYIRNLNLSINNPIQLIYNYENEKNEKIYWVDGKNQLRFLNLRHSIENGDKENLIDLNADLINSVSNITLSQPKITRFSQGGIHTSGLVQYGYNLYKTNLNQSVISPLTSLTPLSSNITSEGGNVNDVVSSIPIIELNNLDLSYTNIRVYALKYNSINETPKVSIISDRSIPDNGSLTIYDDGNTISDISLEQFAFLGSEVTVPKHIESKDNQLFKFNIREDFYQLENFDARAYSFNSLNAASVWSNTGNIINNKPATPFTNIPLNYVLSKTHDSINPDYNIYKYQKDGSTLGGEGKYLKYELSTTDVYNKDSQYFKSNEIYRISVEFYNSRGQKALPKWIGDFIAPDNNLNGLYNTLTVELKSEFYDLINLLPKNEKPIGYKILRADRKVSDRTILCQGIINPMIGNKIGADKKNYGQVKNTGYQYDQQVVKYPSLIRTFEFNYPMLQCANNAPLANNSLGLDSNQLTGNSDSEGYKASSSSEFRGQLFQFNNMMQMYTPDVLFDSLIPDSTHELRIKGMIEQSNQQTQASEINYVTQVIGHSGKISGALSPYAPNANTVTISGDARVPLTAGIFAPPGASGVANLHQFYREFKGAYEPNVSISQYYNYSVYGSPEVQVLGQGVRTYNNDSDFRYSNNYTTILQDLSQKLDKDKPAGRGYNSNSINSITFVLGDENFSLPSYLRPTIEKLHEQGGFSTTNGLIVSEFVKPDSYKYIGNIYGGNNYESKLRTSYIGVGDYKDISVNINVIDSPGDTFVSDYTFTKSSKINTTIASAGVNQLTEIISFKVETTVDLKNRNDNSIQDWDSTFQPTYESFQKYNKIYSQKQSILKRRNVDANFKEINDFGTTIVASKKKIAGEFIDSWTDNLVNETIDLDGKYGSINGTINFKDQIYTFQDKAVCAISINPRVQTQASDGLSLELGTGRVLQDYKYITTKSGSINKWGIVAGARGIYYYDTLNKSLFRVQDNMEMSLSDSKGLRSWFHNNHDYTGFKIDNPLIDQGVLLGYDTYNKDVYITLSGKVNKTRVFNEKIDQFVDTKFYVPRIYIDSSHKFFGTVNGIYVYEHGKGLYNNYYGYIIRSIITLLVNPEPDLDCIFNNIVYKSEVTIDGIDQQYQTLTYSRAYNEHQETSTVPYQYSVNIARKFRDWKALVPRVGRDRIRNPWMYLELGFESNDNKKLVLHDINVLYTI